MRECTTPTMEPRHNISKVDQKGTKFKAKREMTRRRAFCIRKDEKA